MLNLFEQTEKLVFISQSGLAESSKEELKIPQLTVKRIMQKGFFVRMDEKIVRTYRVLIFQFFRRRRNMETHLAIEVLRQDPLIIALAFSMLVFQKYFSK